MATEGLKYREAAIESVAWMEAIAHVVEAHGLSEETALHIADIARIRSDEMLAATVDNARVKQAAAQIAIQSELHTKPTEEK